MAGGKGEKPKREKGKAEKAVFSPFSLFPRVPSLAIYGKTQENFA
jgi:hypothetical protein